MLNFLLEPSCYKTSKTFKIFLTFERPKHLNIFLGSSLTALRSKLTFVAKHSCPLRRIMAEALKGLIETTAFLTTGQRNAFFAAGSFPADLTSAKVRFNARTMLASQFLLFFVIPNFANRNSTQFVRL